MNRIPQFLVYLVFIHLCLVNPTASATDYKFTELNSPPGLPFVHSYNNCCSPSEFYDYLEIGETIVAVGKPVVQSSRNKLNLGLYVSKDSGASWRVIDDYEGSSPGFDKVRVFYKILYVNERIYVLSQSHYSDELSPSLGEYHGVLYSDNKGVTWSAVDKDYKLIGKSPQAFEIYTDAEYLYVSNADINDNSHKIYKIPHALDSVATYRPRGSKKLQKLSNGNWIAAGHSAVVEMNSDFEFIRIVQEDAHVNDIVVNGDYIAIAGVYLYESNDGGYSFLDRSFKSPSPLLECRNYKNLMLINEILYVGTNCGVFARSIKSGNLYTSAWEGDFYKNSNNRINYDKSSGVVTIADSRIHKYNMSSGIKSVIDILGQRAHVVDLERFDDYLYAATKNSGIWRYQNNSWQPVQNGLNIQNNEATLLNRGGVQIYQLEPITLASKVQVLCAGTSLGLYCLNQSTQRWIDISSPLVTQQHKPNIAELILDRGPAVQSFYQVSADKIFVLHDADRQSLFSIAQVESLMAAPQKNIDDFTIASRNISPLERLQKNRLFKVSNDLLKTGGSLTYVGMFPASNSQIPRYSWKQGVWLLKDYSQFSLGEVYTSGESLGSHFLSSDIQDYLFWNNQHVVASLSAGVYFSNEIAQGWIPKNKKMVNKNVMSLAQVGKVLFAATEAGLYYWDPELAEWSLVPETDKQVVTALHAYGNTLYIGTARDGVKQLKLTSGLKRNKNKIWWLKAKDENVTP